MRSVDMGWILGFLMGFITAIGLVCIGLWWLVLRANKEATAKFLQGSNGGGCQGGRKEKAGAGGGAFAIRGSASPLAATIFPKRRS
jgi:hypothetical protein